MTLFDPSVTIISASAELGEAQSHSMQISAETSVSAFFGLATLGLAAAGVIDESQISPVVEISWNDHVLAFIAGLIGGFLFLRGATIEKWPDRIMALITSASWGAMFGPAVTSYATVNIAAFNTGGPLLLLPASAAIGAFMPHVYGLTSAMVEAARNDPDSITDFVIKLRNIRSSK